MTRVFDAAIAFLALAGVASAKGPTSARLCGASGCVTIHGEGLIAQVTAQSGDPFALADPPGAARFFTITAHGHGYEESLVYVPSRGLLRITDGVSGTFWREAPAGSRQALTRLVAGRRGFAPSASWQP